MGCAYKARVYDAGKETSEHTRAFDEHSCWPHYVIARLLMEVRLQCFGKGQREDSWRQQTVEGRVFAAWNGSAYLPNL